LRILGPGASQDAVQRINGLLPTDIADHRELSVGTLWLGVALQGAALGVYVNGAWGSGDERWERVGRWLTEEGVPASAWLTPLTAVRSVAHLSSVGLDLAPDQPPRIKVYFRLDRPAQLADFGASLWTEPLLRAFVREIVGDRQIPLSAFVFCVGFQPERPNLVDVKVDICGHCLRSGSDWTAKLQLAADISGTTLPPWLPRWQSVDDVPELAFIGLACRADGAVRWNAYFKGTAS
jgi:hypothetical protein